MLNIVAKGSGNISLKNKGADAIAQRINVAQATPMSDIRKSILIPLFSICNVCFT